MSHFTNIQTEIRDLASLREACREIGVELQTAPAGQKVKARGYYNETLDCDAVVKLKGPYDVALTREANGSYKITADFYAGHVARELGQNCGKLIQRYGLVKATNAARLKGYGVRRVQGANGSIKLLVSVP
jgi:hypothetical protein